MRPERTAARIVECTGLVGAGKSTLCDALRAQLRRRGVAALSLDEALLRCLRRSRLSRLARRVLTTAVGDRLARTLFFRLLEPCYALRSGCEAPGLAWQVLRSQWDVPISLYERWFGLSRFFRVAGRYRFLRDRLRPGELVVVDEGFVHRAITLYGWSRERPRRDRLWTYFGRLPLTGPLVVVRAPVDVSLRRARARGLPARMSAKHQTAIARFMDNSDRIVALACQFWASADRRLIEIDNGDRLEQALDQLGSRAAELVDWSGAQRAGEPVPQPA